MSEFGYLTPDLPATTTFTCGQLRIPTDPRFMAAVLGALLDLTDEDSWQQGGSMLPADCASMALDMYDSFVASRADCGAM